MAVILKIDRTDDNGRKVLAALESIASGLAILRSLDELRANAIGASAAEMEDVFGVDAGDGQALSDRWATFVAAVEDPANAEYAKLRDLISAVTSL